MGATDQENILSQPAKDVWTLDWKMGSVLHADCYRANSIQNKEDLVLWLSREQLSPEQQSNLLEYVERVLAVRDWGEVGYGIDAERRGFVAVKRGSTKSIDFDHPGVTALRNRFLMCAVLVAKLHEAGVACGNLTAGSFVVNSFGQVHFIGFLGGYAEKVTSSVPLDIRSFIRTQTDVAGAPSVQEDVYALAVLGLTLFGAQFPPASIDPKRMDEYLERVRPDAPPWVRSVLATIVREPSRRLCKDAMELLRSLAPKDAEYLTLVRKSDSKSKAGEADDESPLSLEEIQELYVTVEEQRRRKLGKFVNSLSLTRVGVVLLVCSVLLAVMLQWGTFRNTVPGRGIRNGLSTTAGEKVNSVAGALLRLRNDSSSIDKRAPNPDPGARDTSTPGGATQTGDLSDGVEFEAESKISLESGNILLVQIANGNISSEERSEVLDLYTKFDDASKARLQLAFVEAGGESERLFRTMLEKQFRRSPVVFQAAPETISTDALFLAVESRLSRAATTTWGRVSRLSNEEIWWLTEALSKKRAPSVAVLARVVVDRGLVTWPRAIFFEVAADADEGGGAPYGALFRGGVGKLDQSDVNLFGSWNDPLSIRALLGVLLCTSEVETLRGALTGLMAKPGLDATVRALLEQLSGVGSDVVAACANLVAGVGLDDARNDSFLEEGLRGLAGMTVKDAILATLLEGGSARAIGVVLRVFGKEIHPDTLIVLLDRSDVQIRKAVIPFLTGVTIASSKARIRERYDEEQDPEVRRVFEAALYSQSVQ